MFVTGGAWIGTATDSRVRRYTLDAGDTLRPRDAVAVLKGETSDDAFGAALAVVADQDGDGAEDLLVGAPMRDATDLTRDDGTLYLYAANAESGDTTAAIYAVSGETNSGHFGATVAACGDWDGDGADDLAAGAPWDDNDGGALSGLAWVGLSAARPAAGARALSSEVGRAFTGPNTGASAGRAIACQHDLVGADGGAPDGLADLVVGAPFADDGGGDTAATSGAGALYVVPGGTDAGALEARAALTLRGASADAWLGWSVATGDLNGDGLADLAVGAPGTFRALGDDTAAGEVWIWPGGELADAPAFRIQGAEPGDALGRALAIADIDGDGLQDLLVGAPRRNPAADNAESAYESGTLYIFRGQSAFLGWDAQMDASEAELRLATTSSAYLRTGQAIRVGSWDGDDQADLALPQRYDPDIGVPED